ncbi:unnamed protein product [Larinioides sclopetarius]|uniref:Uncharacterized protein n=1 Tax=Larinioides sclopetarius TaxID=280406 RepID=A0AAV2B6R1_9ARAC
MERQFVNSGIHFHLISLRPRQAIVKHKHFFYSALFFICFIPCPHSAFAKVFYKS